MDRDKALTEALDDVAAYAKWRFQRAAGLADPKLSIFVETEPMGVKHWSDFPRPDLAKIMAQVKAKWEVDRIAKTK